MEFFDSSEKALDTKIGRPVGQVKYPWRDVPLGKSFAVNKVDIKFKVLRSLASKQGKKLGRKFRVIDHSGDSYEVAHVPMDEAEALAKSTNIVQATSMLDLASRFPVTKTEE